jgi:hypothetical protein
MEYILLVLLVLVGYLALTSTAATTEALIDPWDLQECHAQCSDNVDVAPWFGGTFRGAANDPINKSGATFDVARCMARCNLGVWHR